MTRKEARQILDNSRKEILDYTGVNNTRAEALYIGVQCIDEVDGRTMRKEHLDNIRDYIVENIMRNPDYLFSDDVRGKGDTDIDLLTVIASLYEELHQVVTGETYNYMWHFTNKYGAWVDDKLFIDLKEGDES